MTLHIITSVTARLACAPAGRSPRGLPSLAALVVGSCFLQPALAAERELGAHEHGAARLDVALDGERLYIDLDTPADNVLGFEHAPSSDAQRETLAAAQRTLESGELFVPDAAAACALESAEVEIELADREDEHEEGHEEDGHEESAHDDEDGEHGADEHDEASAGGEHSDIEASYVYLCDDPAALGQMTTTLFEAFDGFEDVDVQLVGPGGQDAAELSPGDAMIGLEAIRQTP